MKELEEKILKIINKIGTDNGWNEHGWRVQFTGIDAAKEIAALIGPYKKLIKAQDELINAFKFRMSFIDTDEREDELIKKVTELRKEIKK